MPIVRHPLCADNTLPGLKDVPTDEALIRRLEASFRAIDIQGLALADTLFRLLFARMPELRTLFPEDLNEQKRKFMLTLGFVVTNLRRPEVVAQALRELGERHKAYGVRRDHFDIFRDCLLGAMAERLGRAWTAEVREEWSEAVRLMVERMRTAAGSP